MQGVGAYGQKQELGEAQREQRCSGLEEERKTFYFAYTPDGELSAGGQYAADRIEVGASSPEQKVKREAAAQRRPEKVGGRTTLFPRNDRPHVFETQRVSN